MKTVSTFFILSSFMFFFTKNPELKFASINNISCLVTALHTAGRHMEDSIVASYAALLLGCLLRENKVTNGPMFVISL